jgi:hypothetical protein
MIDDIVYSSSSDINPVKADKTLATVEELRGAIKELEQEITMQEGILRCKRLRLSWLIQAASLLEQSANK